VKGCGSFSQDPLRHPEITQFDPRWGHENYKNILCIHQCSAMRNIQAGLLVVRAMPQALDPGGLSLLDASLGDLRVSVWKYFERFLVAAGYRCAW